MITRQLPQSADDPFLMADELDDQSQELTPENEPAPSSDLIITPKPSLSLYSAYLARDWQATYLINRLAWWKIKSEVSIVANKMKIIGV